MEQKPILPKSEKLLIAVVGPTASGKTDISIKLANHFHTEIISADSRQFYRELNIGVAKPTPLQLSQAPHHFIGHLSIHDSYNAGKFETDALALLDRLFVSNDVMILTGGSGLFVKAVLEGFHEIPPVDEAIREQVRGWFSEKGISFLQEKLKETDPVYFQQTDAKNPARLLRALEVFYSTGKPISSFHAEKKSPRRFHSVLIGLDVPRKTLYERIDHRVDEMMNNGLLNEAHSLFSLRHLDALQTVGYSELFDFIAGKISLEQAVSLIKQHSRNFAKRQVTWFKKMENMIWLPPLFGGILSIIQSEYKTGKML